MESYIRVEPDVRIFVNDMNPSGKKTILFIHGWPANQQMFEYQYNQLVPMGYRCIGIDTRGFGNSDKPLRGYDYDRLADDVLCVVKALDYIISLWPVTLQAEQSPFGIWLGITDTESASLPFLRLQLPALFNGRISLTGRKQRI